MSDQGGKMCLIESVRLSINEHLTSVGEEISCVLEKQHADVSKLVRVVVLERLSAAAEFMCNLFQREIETLETLLERQNKLLHVMLQPHVKLHRAEVSPEGGDDERSSSLVQEKPEEPPQIKEEPGEELIERPEEAEGSTMTCITVAIQNLPFRPVCKEEVSPEHEERSSSLVRDEPEEPPQIKEERGEEFLERPEEANGSTSRLRISKVWSNAASGPSPPSSSQTQAFCCTECPYTFPSQLFLHKHLKRSHNELYFQMLRSGQIPPAAAACQQQPSPSSSETKPKQGDTGHSGGKPFHCKECGKSFMRLDNLKRHERVHTGERPFQCKVCDKSFNQSSYLKTHQRVHTGEKPYQCNLCEKSFSESGGLKRHRRLHTGEKPYHCKQCGKSFRQSGHLKSHFHCKTVCRESVR